VKAIYIEQHGTIDGLKVRDVPKPVTKPGNVLVKIEAAGINPSDLASFQGKFPGAVLPRIIGRDFAGRITEGPATMVATEVWGKEATLGSAETAHMPSISRFLRKLLPAAPAISRLKKGRLWEFPLLPRSPLCSVSEV